jgi:hypothetical protein
MTRPKNLYIAGWGRSGSTLLAQILGGVEGWFSGGELSLIWHDQYCRCGKTDFSCEFWGPVLRASLKRDQGLDAESLVAIQGRWLDRNPAHLGTIALEARRGSRGSRHPVRRYADLLAGLYEIAADSAQARVLIDASKGVPPAYLISSLTDIDLYVVHLVRDPRACAYSLAKTKRKLGGSDRYFGRMSSAASSFNWLRRNALIEGLLRRRMGDRFLRVRYEDFAEQPSLTARSICTMVDEPNAALPFADDGAVRVRGPGHGIAGNPPRSAEGAIHIRRDEEWRQLMDRRSRLTATLAAAPLMPRYGYSLSATGSG